MTEERRLVSVLFADVVGSTAMGHENDPEVVRAVMARYFERVREIVEAHGGSVEKFIGDAAMAVFGVPRLHDDDAERAVRTGLAIRDAMLDLGDDVALGLEARIGVNTGEAVAATDKRQQLLVTGDVVNVAARLQQHAGPGELLVGSLTEQLTREAIDYEDAQHIEVRGKPETLVAFRATGARSTLPEQARGLPAMRARLVGRTRELNLMIDIFERARGDRRAQLFTIVGNAGVGKSRLVGEFLAKISARGGVRVLRGRCLPYGTGITYWPLLEMLQADLSVGPGESRSEVLERLRARVGSLIDGAEQPAIEGRLRVLLGLAEEGDALPDVDASRLPAELGWGVARYLEVLAGESPVVVVIDDLQWAEPPVVEIIGGLLDLAADAAVVAICIGRPELTERYPAWGAGRPNASVIVLEPLSDEDTRTLIGRLLDIDDLPEHLRARIIARAGGNPLFCEEFVRMLIEEGRLVRDGDRWRASDAASLDVRVPESIHALIAARLDSQDRGAKRLIQAAGVIGEAFELDQLAAIADPDDADAGLARLTRAGFIVADRASGPGAYRFRHLLIRDVAYATLPKSERARLHEALGRHLEATAGDRREELLEILAHHAERAMTFSVELRLSGEVLADRARRAMDMAFAAADRALERENASALSEFLRTLHKAEASLGSVPPADAARMLLLDASAQGLGADYVAARDNLQRAAELSIQAGRPDLAAAAYLSLGRVLTMAAAGDEDLAFFDSVLDSAVAMFDQLGDVRGRLEAKLFALEVLFSAGELTRMVAEGDRLAEAALESGHRAVAARALTRVASAAGWLGRIDLAGKFVDRAEALATELGLTTTTRWARFVRARLAWTQGRLGDVEVQVRALMDEAEIIDDNTLLIASARLLGETHLEAGRDTEADAALAAALERSQKIGERWSRTELLAQRARCAVRAGNLVAAEMLLAESATTLRGYDYAANVVYQSALGELREAQGRDQEAEAALRESLETARSTEYWIWSPMALDLAEFLATRGRASEAAALVSEAGAAMAGRETNLRRPQLERLQAQLAGQPA